MKRILVAGAFVLALGGPVLAADLPPPAAPPPRAPATYVPAPAPYYNWGGIYFGVNGGGIFGNSAWNPPAGFGVGTGNFTTTGFLVGGTLGANFQAGAFVFGVEGDLDWDNLSGSTSGVFCGATCTLTTAQNYLGTVRGRVGYAWDRVLFYGTGGGAFGNIKATNSLTGGTDNNNKFGWTAGAGIEFAFAQNWTAKAEYLYVSLQNGSCTASCGGVAVPVSLNENVARIGVNYKFNF